MFYFRDLIYQTALYNNILSYNSAVNMKTANRWLNNITEIEEYDITCNETSTYCTRTHGFKISPITNYIYFAARHFRYGQLYIRYKKVLFNLKQREICFIGMTPSYFCGTSYIKLKEAIMSGAVLYSDFVNGKITYLASTLIGIRDDSGDEKRFRVTENGLEPFIHHFPRFWWC